MASSPLVIGIAGGTASGKSTVAQRILEGLADATDRASNDPMPDVATFVRGDHRTKPHSSHVVMLDQDSYYREFPDLPIEDKREINWDHPDAFDSDLFVAHIQALKRGESIEKPVYSFSSYAREAQSVTLRPGAVLIVEGILVLGTDAIRKELDVRIFVDADHAGHQGARSRLRLGGRAVLPLGAADAPRLRRALEAARRHHHPTRRHQRRRDADGRRGAACATRSPLSPRYVRLGRR
jgi:uridine kinase